MNAIKLTLDQWKYVRLMMKEQETKKKEQFATLIGIKDESGNYIVKRFVHWPEYLVTATEVSVEPNEEGWREVVLPLIRDLQCDFIICLHTHPSWFGSIKTDTNDINALKNWTKFFRSEYNIHCINGVASDVQLGPATEITHDRNVVNGVQFLRYNEERAAIERVDCYVDGEQLNQTNRFVREF